MNLSEKLEATALIVEDMACILEAAQNSNIEDVRRLSPNWLELLLRDGRKYLVRVELKP